MEHIIEYKGNGGRWQMINVTAPNWRQALEDAPEDVRESDNWVISLKTELVSKEEVVHSGEADEIIPE